MDIPLELAFHNMPPSQALASAVRREAAGLERFYDHIIGCRVVIEMPHKSHRMGQNAPDVHVLVRVPGREIVISRELAHGRDRKSATNAYAVLREAFRAVEGRLKDYRRQQRGEVKMKEAPRPGHVTELVAERNYGFLASPDGEQVYFHRNAVSDGGFDFLEVGDAVEFTVVLGDTGQAASRVWRAGAMNQGGALSRHNTGVD
ncbi:MAG TPA: HPF/RaiA family ribosome-associated protein [Rhizomicrobium sp.]|nr:HPF/RaiA family ribosome-associated protein [Rhizomicrobium sp.]